MACQCGVNRATARKHCELRRHVDDKLAEAVEVRLGRGLAAAAKN
jgi:hypothetical protein